MKLVLTVFGVLALCVLAPFSASAHPMPNSLVVLSKYEQSVEGKVQIPLSDFDLATGMGFDEFTTSLSDDQKSHISSYLLEHIKVSTNYKAWDVTIGDIVLGSTARSSSGQYKELLTTFNALPPAGVSTNKFDFNYTAVVHQVITHKVLVSLAQDWSNGISFEANNAVTLGTIEADINTGTVKPLAVDTSKGGLWQGFVGMVQLGMNHIKMGTDHLLFLLILLLPAPLIIAQRRWAKGGSNKRTLHNILKIVTAFTIGHSATLILASIFRIEIPVQPIEVLIAISIIISAIHAIRPIFGHREVWIAGFFGLVHGMAFSFTLVELQLGTSQLAVSLLGFNLGIELMQLLIILLVMPPLIVLSQLRYYWNFVAVFAGMVAIIACGWAFDRLGVANSVSRIGGTLGVFEPYVVGILWVIATSIISYSYIIKRTTIKNL